MPIELHERLSEFSYGYGVTREFEQRLRSQGLSATPFLPSLLHEAKLGFDVGFKRRGAPLLLQFKLGQAMQRFVPGPRPSLDKPYWRFAIDTAETDGQYELLLKAETDGADVFYLAPQFHDWEDYLKAFELNKVVKRSLVVRPGAIYDALLKNSIPDGYHKIVYDTGRAYVCSEPCQLKIEDQAEIPIAVRQGIEHRAGTIAEVLERVFTGFSERSSVRRPGSPAVDEDRSGSLRAMEDAAEARDEESILYTLTESFKPNPDINFDDLVGMIRSTRSQIASRSSVLDDPERPPGHSMAWDEWEKHTRQSLVYFERRLSALTEALQRAFPSPPTANTQR